MFRLLFKRARYRQPLHALLILSLLIQTLVPIAVPQRTAYAAPVAQTSTPIRINAGGSAYTIDGSTWQACTSTTNCNGYVSGGFTYSTTNTITNIPAGMNNEIFQTERSGTANVGETAFTFAIPVSNGDYRVRLHFAELTRTAANQRVFDVVLEGTTVLSNFDIFALVGANVAMAHEFTTSVTDGAVTIGFVKRVENPKISAIEILPVAPNTTPTPTATATGGSTATPIPTSTATPVPTATAIPTPTTTPMPTSPSRVRINAGGAAQTVGTANWEACTDLGACNGYVSGGFAYSEDDTITNIPSNANNTLFQSTWTGGTNLNVGDTAFIYQIPASPGTYTVRLHFAELNKTAIGQRIFDVRMEAIPLLDNFDIFAAAGGANIAVVREYSMFITDGFISLEFIKEVENPTINAIEIIRTSTDGPLLLSDPGVIARINANGPAVTTGGRAFTADQYFIGGELVSTDVSFANTDDDVLYQTYRKARTDTSPADTRSFGYSIPVPAPGSYTINLLLAEPYWGVPGRFTSGSCTTTSCPNRRKFDVSLEGVLVLDNYDINSETLPATAITKTFTVDVTDGAVTLFFDSRPESGGVDRAMIQAIEVLDAAPPVQPMITAALTAPATVVPGESLAYTLTITNTGTDAASATQANVTFPDGSTSTVSVGIVAPNSTVTDTILWSVPSLPQRGDLETESTYLNRLQTADTQPFTAQVSLTWQDSNGQAGQLAVGSATAMQVVPVVSFTTTTPAQVVPGAEVVLTHTVTNGGSGTADDVTLRVTNPDGTLSTALLPSLDANQTTVLTTTWIATTTPRETTESDTAYQSRLQAIGSQPLDFDRTLTWSDRNVNAYGSLTANGQASIAAVPVLTVTLNGPATVGLNEMVTFIIDVTNIGQVAAPVATVSVVLPDGAVVTPSILTPIGPGETRQVSVTYTGPTTEAVDPVFPVRANVTWQDSNAIGYGPVSATLPVTVTIPPTATPIVLPTATPIAPTATATATAVSPTATATATTIPPTATATPTPIPPTATATNTPIPSPTALPIPSTPPVAAFTVAGDTRTVLNWANNLASANLGATVVAASASTSSTTPQNAIDENAATRWETTLNAANPPSLTIQLPLGIIQTIDQIRLSTNAGNTALNAFDVQVSTTTTDEAAFTTVLSASAVQSSVLQEFALPNPVSARYVRLILRSNHNAANCCVSIYTFETIDSRRGGLPSLTSVSSMRSEQYRPENLLDGDVSTYWASGFQQTTNQSIILRVNDPDSALVDRVLIHPGTVSTEAAKDIELFISDTTPAISSFRSVLQATVANTNTPQFFTFPGGAVRARYAMLLVKTNYGNTAYARLANLDILSVSSEGHAITLPADPEVTGNQSPALSANGAVITAFSSQTSAGESPSTMLDLDSGQSWRTTSLTNQEAIIRLGGVDPVTISGVRIAPPGSNESVQDFAVWVSATTDDPAAFTQVLTGTVQQNAVMQSFAFPGGPVAARYIRYVPLSNYGDTTNIATTFFDVDVPTIGKVVAASSTLNLTRRPERMFDHNTATAWESASGALTEQAILVQLRDGVIHPVYSMRVEAVNGKAPRDFSIRVSTTSSDSAAFTTVVTGTLANTAAMQEIRFPAIADARYIEVIWHTSYSTTNIGIEELDILAVPVAGAVLLDASSAASTDTLAFEAINLDRNDDGWRTANGQATNQQITLALPRGRNWPIDRVSIQARNVSTAPRTVEILASTSTWEDAAFTSVATTVLRPTVQEQTVDIPPTNARYLRLRIIDGYSTAEIGIAVFRAFSPAIGSLTPTFIDRSANAGSYVWDFGDGTTSTARDPQHTYAMPGVYTVTLTVANAGTVTDQTSIAYHAFGPPQADFAVTTAFPQEALSTQVADRSTDVLGPLVDWLWTWGDGGITEGSTPTSARFYADSGVYTATLTVANLRGITASTSKPVSVANRPPVSDPRIIRAFAWGEQWPNDSRVSDPSSVDNASLVCTWDYGNGQTATVTPCANATVRTPYAYPDPGVYTATLTVTDKDGGVASDAMQVSVTKRPTILVYSGDRGVAPGEPMFLQAKLRDELTWSAPVAGKTITFTVGTQIVTATTDANGIATVTETYTGTSSIETIQAAFVGDDRYDPSNVTVPATCIATQSPVDVALVIDASASMQGQRTIDSRTGARVVLDSLNLSIDQIALITFAGNASVRQQLTQDRSAMLGAIDSFGLGSFTNINTGINAAVTELLSDRRTIGAGQIMVVLSDGESDVATTQAAANAAKAQGIRIISISLGSAPSALMESIASAPGDYYHAPQSSELAGIYATIVESFCGSRPTPTPTATLIPATATAIAQQTATAQALPTATPTVTATPTPTSTPTPEVAPLVVQGWIKSPLNQSEGSGIVPIILEDTTTLTSGTLEYWPASDPNNVTTLAANIQAAGGSTIGSLDTTLLANDSYVIRLSGTNSTGQTQESGVLVTVVGEYKPGRVRFSVTDLIVPVTGLPITIDRTYDSLDRERSGDFGYGWSLSLGSPRLTIDPAKNVTLTMPNGQRVTFYFTPTSYGGVFGNFLKPGYTAEPGVYGTLTANGCPVVVQTTGGFLCFLADPEYQPTTYTYTDPYGRVYLMGSNGSLRSVQDLNGNVLRFSSGGIVSTNGDLVVPFERDAQGRITKITDPIGNVYRYEYDAAGDLVRVFYPGIASPAQYTYTAGHRIDDIIDPRGATVAQAAYDPDGRLASETDALGYTTQYAYDLSTRTTTTTNPDLGVMITTYDAHGLVVRTTDPLSRTTSIQYDSKRNPISRTNALSQTVSYTYDVRGNQTSVTNPLGHTTTTVFNQYGGPTRITDPLGRVQTISYDARFAPTAITDTLGLQAGFIFDDRGSLTAMTDANGGIARSSYDTFGNRISTTDPLSRTISSTYDPLGRLLTSTDARQAVTRYSYDALGRIRTVTDPLNQVTTFAYDANGNRTAVIDPLGRRTSYTYDAANQLTAVTYPATTSTDPEERTVRSTYTWRGAVETTTDQQGRVTRHSYDVSGQRTSTTVAESTAHAATTSWAYDALGRTVRTTDARNFSTWYGYDAAGRVISTTNALNQTTLYGYNDAGERLYEIDPNNRRTDYAYDPRGRQTVTTFVDTTTTVNEYDGMGNLTASIDQAGRRTSYAYDAAYQLRAVTNALSQTTSYDYDLSGNLTSITDAAGRTTRLDYDLIGRLTHKLWPDETTNEVYGYDAVGNQIRHQLASGQTNAYRYNAQNQLTGIRYYDGTTVSYTYTPTGQRASVTDSRGVTSYLYDAQDRLTQMTEPGGQIVQVGYDALGNRTQVSTASGPVTYSYDALNRLTSVIDPSGAGAGTTTYQYDLNTIGTLSTRTLPNGITTSYSYDPLDRLTGISHRVGTQAPLLSYTYTLGPAGNRTRLVEADGTQIDWDYDNAYRLTGETIRTSGGSILTQSAFGYDAVGNRVSETVDGQTTSFTYNTLDHLTSAGSVQYQYDARGNLSQITDGSAVTQYSWDASDRLTSTLLPTGETISYTYDADGRRVQQNAAGQITNYLWDESAVYGDMVREYDASGATIASYVFAHNDPISNQRGGARSYYLLDGQGSVRSLSTGSATLSDQYSYTAFGETRSQTGSSPQPYGYTGQQRDAATGLYYLRARYYAPESGRFLSRDTWPLEISNPREFNRYPYVSNDPVNEIDPSGLTLTLERGLVFKTQALKQVGIITLVGAAVYCVLTATAQQALGASLVGKCTNYAGVIQIQGSDITKDVSGAVPDTRGGYMLSSPWSLERPLTAGEARSRLATLMRSLNRTQILNRYSTIRGRSSAYSEAVMYTFRCAQAGGCYNPGRSFTNQEFERVYNAPRIDMVISRGVNFK